MLRVPFGAGPSHVMKLGPIGIAGDLVPQQRPGKAGGFLALDWCAGTPLDALAPPPRARIPQARAALGLYPGATMTSPHARAT